MHSLSKVIVLSLLAAVSHAVSYTREPVGEQVFPMDLNVEGDPQPSWSKGFTLTYVYADPNLPEDEKRVAQFWETMRIANMMWNYVKTQPNAAEGNTLLVSCLYHPKFETVYCSTVPRGAQAAAMKIAIKEAAPRLYYQLLKNGATVKFHAEDGAYYLFEASEGAKLKDYGSMDPGYKTYWHDELPTDERPIVATYGYGFWHANDRDTVANGRPINLCGAGANSRDPSCSTVASKLGVYTLGGMTSYPVQKRADGNNNDNINNDNINNDNINNDNNNNNNNNNNLEARANKIKTTPKTTTPKTTLQTSLQTTTTPKTTPKSPPPPPPTTTTTTTTATPAATQKSSKMVSGKTRQASSSAPTATGSAAASLAESKLAQACGLPIASIQAVAKQTNKAGLVTASLDCKPTKLASPLGKEKLTRTASAAEVTGKAATGSLRTMMATRTTRGGGATTWTAGLRRRQARQGPGRTR